MGGGVTHLEFQTHGGRFTSEFPEGVTTAKSLLEIADLLTLLAVNQTRTDWGSRINIDLK